MTDVLSTASVVATVVEGDAPKVIEISVLGTFGVLIDGKVPHALSVGSQRLLAFLALRDRTVGRMAMAGTMWPEATDDKAGASLRSALSRLEGVSHEAVVVGSTGLSLDAAVVVDLRDSQALAQRLLDPGSSPREADLAPAAVLALSDELLPDWYDDWVVTEAEDWRQLRMHALEAQSGLLTASGRMAGAAGAARAAIKVEPLRESPHASLIRVHMAEGNQSEALRVFDHYRALLLEELGLEPTSLISELVVSIRNRRRPAGTEGLIEPATPWDRSQPRRPPSRRRGAPEANWRSLRSRPVVRAGPAAADPAGKGFFHA